MNLLEIDSVTLSFHGKKILSDVYLKCETGEIVGLIGRNGAGKSCLLKMIFGSLRGDSQSVRLNEDFKEQLFKTPNTIHFLHQDGFAMKYLSFDDLVEAFQIRKYLDPILEIKEIRNNRKEKLGNLSIGEKKLIETIILLYAEGQFLLLDEPFSYLSPVLVEDLISHIIFQSRLKGIIITDHQYRTVLSVCTKYYILQEGAIKEFSEASQLEDFGYLIKGD